MDLATLWFAIIAAFWLGYLFLEGFDFGVGMLLRTLGRTDTERRVVINTIGPVWDGNEVWLIVAIGAMFAAFPGWYASLLSGVYLPVLVILLALIGRGVAFEYRGKVDSDRWRSVWDTVIGIGSWVPAFGVGLLLATMVLGLPLDADGNRVGSPLAAVRWETVLGGLAFLGFALVHGAVFLTLKTEGEMRTRAKAIAVRTLPVALVPMVAFLALVHTREGAPWTVMPLVAAVVCALVAWFAIARDREGISFVGLGVLIAAAAVTVFGSLHPNVLPSTLDPEHTLTIADTAAGPYALSVITWVAAFGAPAVLVYQGWTYWVFRKRIGTNHIPPVKVP
ncbi:cytochrome d ubiquinol oxidase subunit II [Haloechinothrix sp. LS1_15]|uniref:cytochrome d ubiquinol oxidase subunit II n=1 Tax=Haloechinothrix sp. LS1_15 TaxID=2652248 RepID=UPI0029486E23|nr:cytochrome d ubiquinol oxidase subunit II [Haloechinothrix sp. LS1_15]MDV6014519.1 cytochrome d ubiquinol oxidase subunit II [Haloechinothrix sp. LS1_15]